MKLNTNELVRVRLTPLGQSILKAADPSRDQREPDIHGRYEFQVWELMNLFGRYMYNGAPPIILDNTIIIGSEL